MYLDAELHGHGVSGTLPTSGAPTEWSPRVNSPSRPSASSTLVPTRAMMCIEATT